MEKERKLTVKELKVLHLLCGSWIRRNESIDNRKKSVAEVRTLQHKLFWLYNEYPFEIEKLNQNKTDCYKCKAVNDLENTFCTNCNTSL